MSYPLTEAAIQKIEWILFCMVMRRLFAEVLGDDSGLYFDSRNEPKIIKFYGRITAKASQERLIELTDRFRDELFDQAVEKVARGLDPDQELEIAEELEKMIRLISFGKVPERIHPKYLKKLFSTIMRQGPLNDSKRAMDMAIKTLADEILSVHQPSGKHGIPSRIEGRQGHTILSTKKQRYHSL
jgi:hypothetical protein